MKVGDDDKDERQKGQADAQKRMEEKKAQDHANRLKEMAEAKEQAMLKKAGARK